MSCDFEDLVFFDEIGTKVANDVEFSSDGVARGGMGVAKFELGGSAVSGACAIDEDPRWCALADSLDEVGPRRLEILVSHEGSHPPRRRGEHLFSAESIRFCFIQSHLRTNT